MIDWAEPISTIRRLPLWGDRDLVARRRRATRQITAMVCAGLVLLIVCALVVVHRRAATPIVDDEQPGEMEARMGQMVLR